MVGTAARRWRVDIAKAVAGEAGVYGATIFTRVNVRHSKSGFTVEQGTSGRGSIGLQRNRVAECFAANHSAERHTRIKSGAQKSTF